MVLTLRGVSLTGREQEVEAARKRLQARAKKLGIRIDDLRDERKRVLARARSKAKREHELEAKIREQRRQDGWWTKRGCIDGATTWRGLVLLCNLVEAKTPWGGGVNSADRTSHASDCGPKSSQAQLYDLFLAGVGAPANPPGTGSHEGIVDDDLSALGFGPVGSKLQPWQWGLDVVDGPGFADGARRLGFDVVRAYGNEPWHVNVRANPTRTLST